ncbi:Chromosome-partitioning protein ParB [Jannaschia seosinensis]|uniref:Chromosome-partitioning protein ParB n=1 Tax=Jannaschia seosinensis TaxID=313367 RepID=A0A0M7BDQ3_9RHOB|nr:ParB/RepB/Spo0J family partition protein [Jannaschia seosinensis]CUH39416.1 Chromosome-partitioning protein ParB [Jannaschia seosinensis]
MADASQKRPMRRGLSALMADAGVDATDIGKRSATAERHVPIETLSPNPDQPRRFFDEDALSDLSASIAQKGILQPLIVRPLTGSDQYQIVAGERRWRAAQRAGLHEVPVLVRDFSDTEVLEIGIIENIQRADLNAIEEALGFRQLMDRFGHTQDQLSTVLGKSRSHIANLMRLLKLPDPVQEYVRQGTLSAGHARALISSEQPEDLARQVISRGLSVRDTEKLVKGRPESTSPTKKKVRSSNKDADTKALEGDLSAALSLGVTIDHDAGAEGGSVTIRYDSLEELDRLCNLLSSGLGEDSR